MSKKIEIEYVGTNRPEAVKIATLQPGDAFVFQSSLDILDHNQVAPAIFCGFEDDGKSEDAIYYHIGDTEFSFTRPYAPVIPIKAKLTWSL